MHSDNKHTDKKLQELENLSLPDLSKMDEHWQQMKTNLQPASMPSASKSPTVKKLFRWMVAAVLIGGLSLVAYKFITRSEMNRQEASGKINQPSAGTKDSVPGIKVTPLEKAIIQNTITLKSNVVSVKSGPVKLKNSRTSIIFRDAVPLKKDTVTILNSIIPDNQPKASLDKFFKQLEKGVQQFVIHNNKDTMITGEDGTVLHIPANTFNNKGEVIITLKEFYSYEDIITNKLTTCSDGRQLVTGGMIHLSASVDGKQVDVQPGKSIQWFVPDTSKEMSQMQLFTALSNQPARSIFNNDIIKVNSVYENKNDFVGTRDTLTGGGNQGSLNWIPQERSFMGGYLVTSVKVLDLKNEPMKTRHKKSGDVGIFRIADKPKISAGELEKELKEKYSYYKVKIKKHKKTNIFTRLTPRFLRWRRVESTGDVGDSAWVPLSVAKQYNLQATDTFTSVQRRIGDLNGTYKTKTFANINMNNLAKRFSVDIRTLGWINCDRFYNNNNPKIDYYVDLKDTASNYYTLLVFDNIRSMIQGRAYGNKVIFSAMPEGESAKVISVGIQNGKTVAAMEPVRISRNELSSLKFEDTSPVAFKEDVKVFDK